MSDFPNLSEEAGSEDTGSQNQHPSVLSKAPKRQTLVSSILFIYNLWGIQATERISQNSRSYLDAGEQFPGLKKAAVHVYPCLIAYGIMHAMRGSDLGEELVCKCQPTNNQRVLYI